MMNRVNTILKNGKIYTSGGLVEGGAAIADGKIVAIGKSSALPISDEVIDCNGHLVIIHLTAIAVEFQKNSVANQLLNEVKIFVFDLQVSLHVIPG